MPGKLIFITGGIKSGKSAFAEKITAEAGQRVLYLATAKAGDHEMKTKIKLHQDRRPKNWDTIEESVDVKKIIKEQGDAYDVILLDCLTMLITNYLFCQETSDEVSQSFLDEIIEEIKMTAVEAKNTSASVVVVSNEVGLSLVSDNVLGRRFQELVGRANGVFAQAADTVYLVVSGYPLTVKEAL